MINKIIITNILEKKLNNIHDLVNYTMSYLSKKDLYRKNKNKVRLNEYENEYEMNSLYFMKFQRNRHKNRIPFV